MLSSFISIIICLTIVLAGFGAGLLVERFTSGGDKSAGERFVTDTSLGLGFVSLVCFAFGALHLYSSPGIYALLALLLIGAVRGGVTACRMLLSAYQRAMARHAAGAAGKKKAAQAPRANRLHMLIYAIVSLILLLCLINALAPSVSDDWDSLAYHLSVPKMFLQHGGFFRIDGISHSNFPMFQELLYIPAIFLGHPVGGKLMSWVFCIFTICAAGYTVSRHFGKQSVPVTVLAIASMPIYLWLASTAYIDVATGLYSVLALSFMLSYLDHRRPGDLLGLGLALGIEASVKFTGLQFMLIFALWLAGDSLIREKRFPLKALLWMLAPAVLVCLPWYLKTFIYTGNPVYPFFYGLFGGRGWDRALADVYAFKQSLFGAGHSIRGFVLTPIKMTTNPELFYDQPGLYVGPVILMIFPCLCLLVQTRGRKLTGLGAMILLQYVIWFALTHQSRYLLPMFIYSAIFIAAVIHSIRGIRAVRGVLTAIFLLSAGITLLQMNTTAFRMERFAVVTGSITQKEYVTKYFSPYRADMFVNSLKEKDMKVALLGDTRGFYLDKPYVWADSSHNLPFNKEYETPEELAENLLDNGCTHAMVSFGYPGIGRRESAAGNNLRIFEAIDAGYLAQVFPEERYDPSQVFLFRVIRPKK
ncbi:MAG: glycosyltransferase family 39 protein [Abditibacteriota bacterium]|nr:glycosyltransferase family 39 protein [Abditibacteriota bacterium]